MSSLRNSDLLEMQQLERDPTRALQGLSLTDLEESRSTTPDLIDLDWSHTGQNTISEIHHELLNTESHTSYSGLLDITNERGTQTKHPDNENNGLEGSHLRELVDLNIIAEMPADDQTSLPKSLMLPDLMKSASDSSFHTSSPDSGIALRVGSASLHSLLSSAHLIGYGAGYLTTASSDQLEDFFVALHDSDVKQPSTLSFCRGDIIRSIESEGDGWSRGLLGQEVGLYETESVSPYAESAMQRPFAAPPHEKYALALHSFDPVDPGDLGFRCNDVIQVTELVPGSWSKGSLGFDEGIFPSNYVQLCSFNGPTCRKLMAALDGRSLLNGDTYYDLVAESGTIDKQILCSK